MPIDASIYNTKAPESYNPLKTLGDTTAISNAMQQNKLLQIQQERDAIGVDQAKVALSKEQYDLGMKQYGALNKVIADLGVNPTQKDIINAAVAAKADGLISSDQLNRTVTSLPEDTPENNRAFTNNMRLRLLDGAAQLEQIYGKNVTLNAGGQQKYGVQQSPIMGGGASFPSQVDNTLTPQEQAARVNAVNAKGEPISVPQSQLVTPTGMPKDAPEEKFLTEGDINAPSQSATAAGGVPEEVIAPGGVLQTGFAPGEVTDREEQAKQGTNLQTTADNVPQRKDLLNKMDSLIKSGDFNSGPGAEQWKELSAALQRPFGIQSQSVSSQEEFKKLSGMVAQEQFKALGGTGTDRQLGSSEGVSPSTALSNMGNARIIALLKGNEDAISAKSGEWLKWKEKNGAGSYSKFSKDFNSKFDPKVFQAQHMNQKDRTEMLNDLSDKEYDQYKKDYDIAHKNGWLKK